MTEHARDPWSTSLVDRAALRLVADADTPTVVESAVSPDGIGVVQFVLITTLRRAAAPIGVVDDLRIAMDELLAPLVLDRCHLRATVVAADRTVSVELRVDGRVDDMALEHAMSLVDDLRVVPSPVGTIIALQRRW